MTRTPADDETLKDAFQHAYNSWAVTPDDGDRGDNLAAAVEFLAFLGLTWPPEDALEVVEMVPGWQVMADAFLGELDRWQRREGDVKARPDADPKVRVAAYLAALAIAEKAQAVWGGDHITGLVVSDGGAVLNWQGENYVRQLVADEVADGLDAANRAMREQVANLRDTVRALEQGTVPVSEPFPAPQEPHDTVPPNGPVEVTEFVIYPYGADPDNGGPYLARACRRGSRWAITSDYLPDPERGFRDTIHLPEGWDAIQARSALIGVAEVIRDHLIARRAVTDSAVAAIVAMTGQPDTD